VRALRDEPILVFGDGQQSRCFSAVSDGVRGVLMLAESREAEGQVFNVGSNEEITVMELARRIRQMCESRSEIEIVPYEKVYGDGFEDLERRAADTTRLRTVTGYSCDTSLDATLDRMIDFARQATLS